MNMRKYCQLTFIVEGFQIHWAIQYFEYLMCTLSVQKYNGILTMCFLTPSLTLEQHFQTSSFKARVVKLWPTGQIQLTTCFCN